MDLIRLMMRFLLGAIFLFSGYQKLSLPLENFEAVLRAYEIFPEFMITFISQVFPIAEVAMGICLMTGFLTRLTYLATVGCYGFFIFILSRSILLKLPLRDCGCFGTAFSLPLEATLGIDIFLLLFALILLFSKHTPFRLESFFFSP